MAQIKFYRKSTAPTSPVVGGIWFNTSDKTIQVYTAENTWEKYAGNLNNATWANNTLTITKHDGSSIALDFSDMASATAMATMISALGLNDNGTFKKNAANYGGSATNIGDEIKNVDAALKTTNDNITNNIATKKELSDAIADLDASKTGESTHVNVTVTEVDGKITGVEVTNSDIASATTLAEVKATVDAFFDGADISETANQYKDTLKELQDYITTDAAAASTMAGNISKNTANITALASSTVNGKAIVTSQIGTDGKTTLSGTAVTLAGSDVKITGYTKGTATSLAATDTINDALGKLEAKADLAAVSGVLSLNSKTGDVTIASGSANGTISVGDDDVAVTGLGTAAYKADTYFATSAAVSDIVTNTLPTKLEASDITTGTTNGTFKVKGTEVAVAGLKSAAYTETSAYATAAQGAKADSAYQKPETGIPFNDMSEGVQISLGRADRAINEIAVVHGTSQTSLGTVTAADDANYSRTSTIKLDVATVTELSGATDKVLANTATADKLVDGTAVIRYVNSVVSSSVTNALEWAEF